MARLEIWIIKNVSIDRAAGSLPGVRMDHKFFATTQQKAWGLGM